MWNAFVHVPHLQTPCQQIMTGVTSAKQRHCGTLYGIELKKIAKNLVVSPKSSTFAPEKIKYWDMV